MAAVLSMATVQEVIHEVIGACHFFAGASFRLDREEAVDEEIPWEVVRGRLLDRAHTNRRQAFRAWNLYALDVEGRAPEPLLSVKLDRAGGQLQIMRAILCHAWEGYHAGDNVYLSRETRKWIRELVTVLDLGRFRDAGALGAELAQQLFRAVVGVSRLPLTSVEAPLPAFSLGQFAYFYRPGRMDSTGSMHSSTALLSEVLYEGQSELEQAKLLEFLLRSTPASGLDEVADELVRRWPPLGHTPEDLVGRLRRLFDEVALSPYTDFVDHTLWFVDLLEAKGYLSAEAVTDFLGYLLRQLARHLTAYDLHVFHHQGANYPDALLLDAVLKALLRRVERSPALFVSAATDVEATATEKRLRRRALRQGWVVRRYYEGLPVPDAPTSPGENARVLPPPFVRIPEEQILVPARRTRRLYDADPVDSWATATVAEVLKASVRDLCDPRELRELGMAVFIDRPLGVLKAPGEPDATLLLAYDGFSRSVAARRLRLLAEWSELLRAEEAVALQESLVRLRVPGLAPPRMRGVPKPGTVSLFEDAQKAAEDFILVRTTRKGVSAFLEEYDFTKLRQRFSLEYLDAEQRLLIVRGERAGTLVVYDAAIRRRLEFRIVARQGDVSRGGGDSSAGLLLLHSWDVDGAEVYDQARDRAEIVVQPSDPAAD